MVIIGAMETYDHFIGFQALATSERHLTISKYTLPSFNSFKAGSACILAEMIALNLFP